MAKQNINNFWGEFILEESQTSFWQLGPLSLWLTRFKNEWQIIWKPSNDISDTRFLHQSKSIPPKLKDEDLKIHRYVIEKTTPSIKLTAKLANRPVVVKPEVPISIPQNQEVMLYIGSTLWVQISTEKPNIVLADLPLLRLSDTWFGPNTTEGELCYAAKTSAKINYEDFSFKNYRAITCVSIKNKAEYTLNLEKFKLNVPNLSLYKTTEGQFFTETVFLENKNNKNEILIKIGKNPPIQAKDSCKVSKARQLMEASGGVRAIYNILGVKEFMINT